MNAEAAGLDDRVEVRLSDIAQALRPGELFSMALVDPPYLRSSEVARFPEDPVVAVDGGPDGLDMVRACLRALVDHLHPDGAALLQLAGQEQAELVAAWLDSADAPDLTVVETRQHGDRGAIAHLHRTRL
jgi:methylase of polypeptide subunit release factors